MGLISDCHPLNLGGGLNLEQVCLLFHVTPSGRLLPVGSQVCPAPADT